MTSASSGNLISSALSHTHDAISLSMSVKRNLSPDPTSNINSILSPSSFVAHLIMIYIPLLLKFRLTNVIQLCQTVIQISKHCTRLSRQLAEKNESFWKQSSDFSWLFVASFAFLWLFLDPSGCLWLLCSGLPKLTSSPEFPCSINLTRSVMKKFLLRLMIDAHMQLPPRPSLNSITIFFVGQIPSQKVFRRNHVFVRRLITCLRKRKTFDIPQLNLPYYR